MNKPCHYITDPKTKEKVLIPGCMGTAAMGIENCTCKSSNKPTIWDYVEMLEKRIIFLESKLKSITKDNVQITRKV